MSFFTSDIDIKLPILVSDIDTLEQAKEELSKAYTAIHLLHAAVAALKSQVTTIKSRIDTAGIP